jgi:hypothetical protein
MKRSEMLKHIEIVLMSRNTGHYSYNEHEHAKRMLDVIENAGMLPPPTFMKGMPKIEGNDCELIWDDENDDN